MDLTKPKPTGTGKLIDSNPPGYWASIRNQILRPLPKACLAQLYDVIQSLDGIEGYYKQPVYVMRQKKPVSWLHDQLNIYTGPVEKVCDEVMVDIFGKPGTKKTLYQRSVSGMPAIQLDNTHLYNHSAIHAASSRLYRKYIETHGAEIHNVSIISPHA